MKTSVIIRPTNRQDVTTVLIICCYGMSDLFIETLCIFMCILYMLSVNNIMLLVDDCLFFNWVFQLLMHFGTVMPKYIIGQRHVQTVICQNISLVKNMYNINKVFFVVNHSGW